MSVSRMTGTSSQHGACRDSVELDGEHHLFTVADDRYRLPLAVLLRSLQEAHPPETAPLVHVFTLGLNDANRRRLERSAPALSIEWIDLRPLFPSGGLRAATGLKPATWGRLFAADILAERFQRAVYMDVDMLVASDLTPLWQSQLSGRPIAAVTSPGNPQVCCPLAGLGAIWKQCGLDPRTAYFQAGLLVIDLAAWRERAISARVAEACERFGHAFSAADQDALNFVVAGDFAALSLRWNQTHLLREPRIWAYSFFPVEEVDDARFRPGVIHFTGIDKPWWCAPGHAPEFGRWWDVLSRTEFAACRPPWFRILRRRLRARLAAWLCR